MPNDPNRRGDRRPGDRGAGPGSTGTPPANPPPGGAAGAAQQTSAAQLTGFMFAPGFGRAARRPRRKTRTVIRRAGPKRRSKRKVGKRKSAKFVKGSAAAKKHMAKLRRMQKRRR